MIGFFVKLTISFSMLLCTVVLSSAQGMPEIIVDDFDNNKGSWPVGSWPSGSSSIDGGVLRIDRRVDQQEWYLQSKHFVDYGADFEIEIRARQMSGARDHGFGIAWGGHDAPNTNCAILSTAGHYRVYSWRGGQSTEIVSWTPLMDGPGIGVWFTLTVRKRGSGMSLLIDGVTIVGFDSPSIEGGKVGLVFNKRMVVEIDKFVVRQKEGDILLADDYPKDVRREHLGDHVNCSGGDISPVITTDGKRLYFGRYPFEGNIGNPANEDIWYTDLQPNGSWGAAQNIGRPLNNEGSNFLVSIAPDGNSALVGNTYSAQGAPLGAGISATFKTESGWSIPTPVRIDRYYNRHRFSESCLDPSGMVLVMAIQRDESRGQKDLYVSFRRDDGSFAEPLNAGKVLNTWGNEMSPFVAADGVTLYFATDGRRGYGDMDIWMTKRLDETWTNWSTPRNLGPSINTDGWDAYYTVPAKGDYAYLSATNPLNNSADLYRVPLTKGVRPAPVVLVSGRVIDASTKLPIAAKVSYESLTKNKSMGIARSEPVNGEYKIVLPAGDLYGFRAEAPGYYPVSDQLDTRTLTEYAELKRDLSLVPLRANETVVLNNIFFDFGQAELRGESSSELDRLLSFLKENLTITIELSGHTDNVGTDDANKSLSQNRVNSVRDYLVQRGVEAVRLKAVGYGKTRPIAKNTTEEGRQRNRRVEFRIVKM